MVASHLHHAVEGRKLVQFEDNFDLIIMSKVKKLSWIMFKRAWSVANNLQSNHNKSREV